MNTEHTGQGAPFDETLPATEPRIASPQPAPAGDWARVAAHKIAHTVWHLDADEKEKLFASIIRLHAPKEWSVKSGQPGVVFNADFNEEERVISISFAAAPTQQQAEVGGEAGELVSKWRMRLRDADKKNRDASQSATYWDGFIDATNGCIRDVLAASPSPESPEGDNDKLYHAICETTAAHENKYNFVIKHASELDAAILKVVSALPAKGPGPGRSDTERLDWLVVNRAHVSHHEDGMFDVWRPSKSFEDARGKTARQAIDAAMEAKK